MISARSVGFHFITLGRRSMDLCGGTASMRRASAFLKLAEPTELPL